MIEALPGKIWEGPVPFVYGFLLFVAQRKIMESRNLEKFRNILKTKRISSPPK